jgi:hypothetical protein
MRTGDQELIDVLETEAKYRRESGPNPVKRDTAFIADAESAVAKLRAKPGDRAARENARKIANRIQSKPLRGRRMD